MTPARGLDAATTLLGHVDLPTGNLLILDPGLGNYWMHREPPFLKKAGPETDFRIEGRDAVTAAKAYDRQFDPGYLFDIPERAAKESQERFTAFCAERGYEAALVPMSARMPHVDRAHSAIAAGDGIGVAQYCGMWATVVGGFDPGERVEVYATPMPAGEFEGRWQRIDLIRSGITIAVAEVDEIEGVMVEHGQFLFADLEAFGSFRMWQSLDGLGDFVFWGRDAASLAAETGAADLGGGEFGWKDLPMDELRPLAGKVSTKIKAEGLALGEDFRPHCNLEVLNSQVRANDTRAGTVVLEGSTALGMDNRWGDGIFTVQRHRDSSGRIVKLVLDLATEKRQTLMRGLRLRHCFAVVSQRVLRGGELIGFGERSATEREQDSGWAFWSGLESEEEMDDAKNFTLVRFGDLIAKDKALEFCLTMPEECFVRREGEGFVLEG